jgi:CRP/FNR family transcriptional regulator, cyclic AMP receptor protein
VLRGNADIGVRLIELLVFKIRKMSERVFEVSALGVRERVRRELLRLATEGTAFRNGVVIQPAPTHYEIAARIGSHREAVTREFNRLESENIIEVRRKQIRIIDLERLKHVDGE